MKLPMVISLLFAMLQFTYSQQSTHQNGSSDRDWRTINAKDHGQLKWHEIMIIPDITFEELQRAFYKEWESKPYKKGQGYKQFKRWERMLEGGKSVNEHIADSQSSMRSSSVANWSLLGPSSPPSPPQNSNYSGWNNEGVGRIDLIEFEPGSATNIYAGSPNGGLWKSTNDGVSWTLISDNSWTNSGVSDIAIDHNNPNIIYAATGSRDGGIFSADGIMKTTNGGTSWSNLSIASGSKIYRLLIDPTDGTKLLAACQNGILYSTDSGASWNASGSAGFLARDLEFKPGDPSIAYSCADGFIYKSSDSGISFSALSLPFVPSDAGRISLAVSPDEPSSLYAMVADDANTTLKGVYKSTNEGTSWNLIADINSTLQGIDNTAIGILGDYFWGQVWYDWTIAVNPMDGDEIIIGDISAFRTDNGGSLWKAISTGSYTGGSIHVDMHHANYNQANGIPYIGCDGGLYKFVADGIQWSRLNDMSISEMYVLAASETNPDVVITGQQDNGAFYNDAGAWSGIRIGDVLTVAIDPVNPDLVYCTTTTSDMTLFKSSTSGFPWTAMLSESQTGDNLPSSFNQPDIIIHPCLRHVIYSAFENVFKSVDGGDSWTNISNGGVGAGFKEHIAVAPSDPNYIYTSTYISSQGGFYMTSNGGSSWNQMTWPIPGNLIDIVVDDNDPLHIYALDLSNGVYESTDAGNSWNYISATVSAPRYYAIDHVQGSNGELYLTTTDKVYFKDASGSWSPFNFQGPTVPGRDIQVCEFDNTVKMATYGRGLWSSPLENNANTCYAATPTIGTTGTQYLCTTSSLALTSSSAPSGYSYQWFKDDTKINGATSITYNANSSGVYSVVFTGACKSYSSNPVKVVLGCLINACNDYNPNSWQGPGNTTIVSFNGPFETPTSGTNVEVCISIEGDNSLTSEQFDVSDENGNALGTTSPIADCGGKSTFCLTFSDTQFNNWSSDNVISFVFDPISTAINPILCTINEACVDIVYESNANPCAPNATENGNPIADGIYEVSNTINSAGTVPLNGDVEFSAGATICLDPGFTVAGNSSFYAQILGCTP